MSPWEVSTSMPPLVVVEDPGLNGGMFILKALGAALKVGGEDVVGANWGFIKKGLFCIGGAIIVRGFYCAGGDGFLIIKGFTI